MNDLIDRQKAIEAIKKCVQDMRKYPLPDGLKKTVAENILKDVPSVDTVPVRHGQWFTDDEIIDCSICRREKWSRVPYEDLVKRFRYCPNCGARMDGGKSDDT